MSARRILPTLDVLATGRRHDRPTTWRIALDALQKARAHRVALAAAFADVVGMARLVQAWAAGEYTRVPWRTIALAMGALLYFLNPLDLIPDMILFAGYLDDVAVIGMVMSSIRSDLEHFRRWDAHRRGAASEVEPA